MERYSLYNILTIILLLNFVFCTEGERVMVIGPKEETQRKKIQMEDVEKGLVIGGERTELIIQTVKYDSELAKKVKLFFEPLRGEFLKENTLGSYYDVLNYIDKSISLTYELDEMYEDGIKKNEMIFEKLKDEAKSDHENFKALLNNVRTLCCEKKDKNPNSPYLKGIWERLLNIKKYVSFIEDDQLKYYSNFNISEYPLTEKVNLSELRDLKKKLKELRNVICPLGFCEVKDKFCPLQEKEFRENINFFKGEFKTAVSKIYESLFNRLESENKKLTFLFDALKTISNTFKVYTYELETYKKKLNEAK